MADFMSAAPPAIKHAVLHFRGEGIGRPAFASRHHIGMAGKAEMRRAIAQPGIEIVHLAKGQAMGGETQRLQHRFQQAQRAGILRCHRGVADQGLGPAPMRLSSFFYRWASNPATIH